MIFGFLLVLATSSAASAQDVSTVGKVSLGTAAITAGVVLLHGHDSPSSTSSTGNANAFTGSDIGRGGHTNGGTFSGAGNNTLAPGGAAGIQTASSGSYDGGAFLDVVFGSSTFPIITILTCATSTLATTTSSSTASTGTSP
jgi:hypothetical protein